MFTAISFSVVDAVVSYPHHPRLGLKHSSFWESRQLITLSQVLLWILSWAEDSHLVQCNATSRGAAQPTFNNWLTAFTMAQPNHPSSEKSKSVAPALELPVGIDRSLSYNSSTSFPAHYFFHSLTGVDPRNTP